MAKALAPGRGHRRAFFGFFDADGWTWAGVKAGIWLLIIIMLLGYIPDRAYYFTVGKTIDLGLMFWSPINLCPAENDGLPCPPPAGAVEPWQLSPTQLDLPESRTGGAVAQIGSNVVYIGGSDGSSATSTTFLSKFANGSFGAWGAGPAMSEARTGAGLAVLNGTVYLVGGSGADGKPTATIWTLGADPTSGVLGTWGVLQDANKAPISLPEARSGAAVLALPDGLLVAGGLGPDGKPSATVWKSTADSKGNLGTFERQADLPDAVTDAGVAFVGTYVWVYGGTDADGPTGAVQRGFYGLPGTSGAAASAAAAPTPAASGAAAVQGVQQWAISDAANAPARTAAAAFSANGTMYLVGGDDGHGPQPQLYWAVPDANGNLPTGWSHLDATDLGGGLKGAAPLISGSTVFLVGGSTAQGPIRSSVRASLAPQPPFFQLGIAGATIPALEIPGEIGQQLGYLAAAGVGTGNFVILVALGWVFNNRPKVRAWVDRRRGRSATS